MSADVATPLRDAIISTSDIVGQLTAYLGSYPVFTRRPAPPDAPYPLIMISPDVTVVDQDGVDDRRPIITRDIAIYGQNDTPENYRGVEDLSRAIFDLFHRQRQSIEVDGWNVIQITATGPRPGPTDDDQTVGRIVTLTIALARQL